MKKEPLGAEEIGALMDRSGSYVRRVLSAAPGTPPPVGTISNLAQRGRLMRVWDLDAARKFILEHEARPQAPRSPVDYGFDPDEHEDDADLKGANDRFVELLSAERKRGP